MSITVDIKLPMTLSADTETSIHQSVGYWASLLSRSMEAEFGRRLAPHGLTRMSYAVLGAIVFDGQTAPSGVAEFLGVDRAAVTRLLDKLEGQGLILRDKSKADGRSFSIKATHQGQRLAREMQAHSRAVNALFTKALGDDDQSRFIEMVKEMLATTDTRLDSL